jgi:flagellar biosynthetic protein FlhB
MAAAEGNRTEKATPKRREEARKEGQVARSMEINSALAMFAGFAILAFWGPHVWATLAENLRTSLHNAGKDSMTTQLTVGGVMHTFTDSMQVIGYSAGPFLGVLCAVGVLANVMQVKFRITPQALKPKFSKINPINGFKQRFSPASLVELAKQMAKLLVVSVPAAVVVWNQRNAVLALSDAEPIVSLKLVGSLIVHVGFVITGIYVVVAIADYIWQRQRYEKQLRMTKYEVKQEHRQQDMAPEMKAQQRRRQREAARRRMLLDVPTADVVITNPTHYAVALKYMPEEGAPKVVAKGADLLAKRIREVARDSDVSLVENPPLARALYGRVQVGQVIPAELFTAVAEILAYVYRTDRSRSTGRTTWTDRDDRRLEHA